MKLRLAFKLLLASIPRDTKPNIAALAREYAVLEQRPRAGYNGRKSRSNCGGAGHILTDDQEIALCDIIECEKAHGTHLQHWQLENQAN